MDEPSTATYLGLDLSTQQVKKKRCEGDERCGMGIGELETRGSSSRAPERSGRGISRSLGIPRFLDSLSRFFFTWESAREIYVHLYDIDINIDVG